MSNERKKTERPSPRRPYERPAVVSRRGVRDHGAVVRQGEPLHLSRRQPAELVIGQLGLDLPPSVRARIELLRERAQRGMTVTCGGVSMEPAIPAAIRCGCARAGRGSARSRRS
jgi:hypothetical protein